LIGNEREGEGGRRREGEEGRERERYCKQKRVGNRKQTA
jgi:hypothetical protein